MMKLRVSWATRGSVVLLLLITVLISQIGLGTSSEEEEEEKEDVCLDTGSQCSSPAEHHQTRGSFDCASYLEGTGVVQDTGEGKIPQDIVQKVKQAICDGNSYHIHLSQNDSYRLIMKNCINNKPLCAYWSVRGQCKSESFHEFMATECPLSCQFCQDAESIRARAFLDFLYQDLTQAYQEGKRRNMVRDRQRALSKLMKTLDMDPKLLKRPLRKEDGNWMLDLHQRLMALIPPAMLLVYTQEPSLAETKSLTSIHGLALDTPPSRILSQTAVAYRHRGHIMNILAEPMDHLIIRPIQLGIAFAIPNQQAVEAIQALNTPVLEVGAGSGYWTSLLRHAGVQVEAYDLHGTTSSDHEFYDAFYTTNIHQGACVEVLGQKSSSSSTTTLAQSHTLLMIWPNDPDPIDNPQFCTPGSACAKSSQPVWDAACLDAYYKAGGTKVVFVGERKTVLQEKYGSTQDTGISATRQFQHLLQERYALQQIIQIPTMWLNEDDMTIWNRKE